MVSDQSGDRPFYVMPLYKSTLREFLHEKKADEEKIETFVKILDGVEAAHLRNIIHRDLKPENVLLNPGTDDLVIADFGIAHFEEEDLQNTVETSTSERLANWEYASPEQRRAGQVVDKRADIYSLGLMLVELFTGAVPHGADPTTIASVAPEYSYLDAIANSMRQHLPERRPESIAEIKTGLIARRLDFVQQQRIDSLKRQVIPVAEISDPLIDDPIRLVDVDYKYSELIFTLSQAPNAAWIRRFNNQGSFTSLMGSEPQRFGFFDITAKVRADEHSAPIVVGYFKTYIRQTNSMYERDVREQAKEIEERSRRDLQERIDRDERELAVRQRVMANIKL